METIFTITYVSFYGGQLYSETRVYNDRSKMKSAYKAYVNDIADNIYDDGECEDFKRNYIEPSDICANVHWESLDGTQMYMLTTEVQIINE